ncbi:MAG: AraC family transcriptional regulator [Candidatus Omnitrophica bacterium]|nr:AraC family transcriptional regulator [Candidatus Omnitrophota bacterium]
MPTVPQRKGPHFENVPVPEAASFTFREFRWSHFPFNWHYHPELELTLIVSGCGLRFVGDSVEHFDDGDLCLLGANLPHCWASEAKAPRGVCSLVIQFRADQWGEKLLQLPETRALQRLLEGARQGLSVRDPTRRGVGQMMLEMTKTPAGSWQRLNHLFAVLGKLAECTDCAPLASSSYDLEAAHKTQGTLGRILGFVHANLGANLTQRAVAEAMHMSSPAFSRFFKRVLGKTYVAYVNELKIHQVCRALIETNQTIAETAFAAGFNNLSNFNEQFRRRKGMSPSAYRQKLGNGLSHEIPGSANDWLGAFK